MSLQNQAGTTLLSAVQGFTAGSTRSAQLAQLDPLLQAWAATPDLDPRFHIELTGSETRRFQVTGRSPMPRCTPSSTASSRSWRSSMALPSMSPAGKPSSPRW